MNDSTREAALPLPAPQRISGPAELLQAVPYLLGFHPQDSVVLVGLRKGMLVVTARLDIADALVPGMLDGTAESLSRGGSHELVVALYDEPDATPDRAIVLHDAVRHAADRSGMDCIEVLHVTAGRWRSLLCAADGCCPAQGRPMLREVSAFAAAATYSGLVALPDRNALEDTLMPLPAAERHLLNPALARSEDAAVAAVLDDHANKHDRSLKRAIFAAARRFGDPERSAGAELDDDAVARFGVALGSTAMRDSVWLAVDDGRLDGRPLWRELARRLPSPYDACPAFLYGWAAWRAGNGALAGMAAERAVESDPDFTPALVLLAALTHGADPRQSARIRPSRSA